jgi:Cytidylate kinase-like family
MPAERGAAPVVTISAAYGAGGSRIGPGVAQRLGVAFLDRAIPAAVSSRLAVSLEEALAHEEPAQGAVRRLLAQASLAAQLVAGAIPAPEVLPQHEEMFRTETERVLWEHAATGAVILGRAAAVVLRDVPHALHVRLDGPREQRVTQGMRLEDCDRAAAEERLDAADRARAALVPGRSP